MGITRWLLLLGALYQSLRDMAMRANARNEAVGRPTG